MKEECLLKKFESLYEGVNLFVTMISKLYHESVFQV